MESFLKKYWLWAIVLLGCALVLWDLGFLPLREGEVQAILLGRVSWAQYIMGPKNPLFYQLLKSMVLISEDPGWLRLISAPFVLVSVYFLYRALRLLEPDPRVAAVVSLMFLFSPLMHAWVRQVRPYGLYFFLCFLMLYQLTKAAKMRDRKSLLLAGLAAITGLSISLASIIWISVFSAGYLLLRNTRSRRGLSYLAGGMVLVLPLVYVALQHHLEVNPFSLPSSFNLAQFPLWFYLSMIGLCILPPQTAMWMLIIAWAAPLTKVLTHPVSARIAWKSLGILVVVIGPGIFFYYNPPRYFLFLIPLLYWMFARGLFLLPRWLSVSVLLLLVSGWGVHYWNYFHKQNFVYANFLDDFGPVSAELCSQRHQDDWVIYAKQNPPMYYYQRQCPDSIAVGVYLSGKLKNNDARSAVGERGTDMGKVFVDIRRDKNFPQDYWPRRVWFFEFMPAMFNGYDRIDPHQYLENKVAFKAWLAKHYRPAKVYRRLPELHGTIKSRFVNKHFTTHRFVATLYVLDGLEEDAAIRVELNEMLLAQNPHLDGQ